MRTLSHPSPLSAMLLRGLRPLIGSTGRRATRLHRTDLSEEMRRDLGLMDGRAAPPRDPLRD